MDPTICQMVWKCVTWAIKQPWKQMGLPTYGYMDQAGRNLALTSAHPKVQNVQHTTSVQLCDQLLEEAA